MKETNELRAWAHGPDEGDDWLDRIDEFCDRIDREHERQTSEEYLRGANDGYDQGFASADDWLAQHEDAMAEHGWIRLPVDADGVPIHIGDYLHCDETGRDFPCRGYCCSVGKNGERRWTVECSYDAYSGTSEYASARRCRHRHAPTVEDVLREFADRYLDYEGIPSAGRRGVGEALMDEYAKQLRLAEEDK